MNCPRPYSWSILPNKDRVCTYCGSLHPDDMIDIMYKFIQREEGYSFNPSDKGYKVYASRGGVINASDGGIKFYTWHVDEEHESEYQAAWQLIIPVYYDRARENQEGRLADMKARYGS